MWDAIGFKFLSSSDATGGDVVGTIPATMTVMSAPTSMNQTREEPVRQIAERLSMSVPARTWGPFSSFILSICTFGILPLLVWPRRWNAFAEYERRQMISLATFWRRRATPMQAQALDASISQIGPQSIYTIVPILILVFMGMMASIMAVSFFHDGRIADDFILRGDFVGLHRYQWWTPEPVETNLHIIWIASLLIGYICHWAAVRSHALAVESLAMQIKGIAGSQGGGSFVAVSSGLNPLWIVAAVVLCSMHAWWGIPLVLAGAMQRKYMRSTSPRIRRALAEQLMDRPMGQGSFCGTAGCGAAKREGAKFCPRCGANV
jgi:hypothetical protein